MDSVSENKSTLFAIETNISPDVMFRKKKDKTFTISDGETAVSNRLQIFAGYQLLYLIVQIFIESLYLTANKL